MSLEKTTSPRYLRFEKVFYDRLRAEGFVPVGDRFPLAAHELDMLGFRPLVRLRAGRSFVVGVTRGDALVQEQLRYLSDQYYNALGRERNELKRSPTLLRGICMFAYERTPDEQVAGFLMQRVRPRWPFAAIRSTPWILDMERGRLRRPFLSRSPFPEDLVLECVAESAREAA
jgi:hypothetical protein